MVLDPDVIRSGHVNSGSILTELSAESSKQTPPLIGGASCRTKPELAPGATFRIWIATGTGSEWRIPTQTRDQEG